MGRPLQLPHGVLFRYVLPLAVVPDTGGVRGTCPAAVAGVFSARGWAQGKSGEGQEEKRGAAAGPGVVRLGRAGAGEVSAKKPPPTTPASPSHRRSKRRRNC